jgi:hypothetical protein
MLALTTMGSHSAPFVLPGLKWQRSALEAPSASIPR